jgi:hypothetical protein
MDKTKSATVGKIGGAEQASSHSKSAVPHQRINVQTVQNLLLIWLDTNINDDSVDC